MAFRFRAPARGDSEDRILPLVNIVFLLLIFFMLAGRLNTSDPIPVTPPASASEGPASGAEATVLIGPDGRIALDGEIMEDDALEAALRARVAEGPPIALRLKADGRVAATRVVAVMERLRDAGLEKLLLLTIQDEA